MTTPPEQTTVERLLLPLLQTAIPTIIECTILDTIVQANAQGCRITATTHHRDGNTRDTNRHEFFVKHVVANEYKNKQWNDLRRTLLYGRTEVRFYKEILALLVHKGFCTTRVPSCHVAEYNLQGLIQDEAVAWENDDNTPIPVAINDIPPNTGSVLVLDSMDSQYYYQESPLNPNQALKCLQAVAHVHAAAWEDAQLLQIADTRMARGSYHLSTRNPKELHNMEQSWNHFVVEFKDSYPQLFAQPHIQALGTRMAQMARYVSDQLTPRSSPNDPCVTLTHGDFKAMNVFLPVDSNKHEHAVMIDFASTGVGFGMSDVAMIIIHSVRPSSDNSDEMSLVDEYLEALKQARLQYNTHATPYPRDVAMRHYRLACVDYMRFILGRFWKSATLESFEQKKHSKNTTLVNRDIEAAMAWIVKVDTYLQEFEEEKAASVAEDQSN